MIPTFKHFLAESEETLISKVKVLEDLFQEYKVGDKRVASFYALLAEFQAEVSANAVYNVTHARVKEELGYTVGALFENIHRRHTIYHNSDDWKKIQAAGGEPWLDSSIDGGRVKKIIREYEAVSKVPGLDPALYANLKDALRAARVYLEVTEALKAVKGNLIKARKPKPVDPNAPVEFQSRMGSQESVALVTHHLKASVKSVLDDFETQMEAYYARVIKKLSELGSEIPSKSVGMFDFMVFQRCFNYKATGWGDTRKYEEVTKDHSADGYPKKQAERDRTEIEAAFLHKNALKLSSLLDRKQNLDAVKELPGEPVRLHNGTGTLTTGMKFTFTDRSQFSVRNKVIINHTSQGKAFYQYPTTFHDVVLANGEKLAAPSEEKMVKAF